LTDNYLKPWYAVAIPHEDIRESRLEEAVFAANLWAVSQGKAAEVYLDPEAFFTKSYLTSGLTNVLTRVSRALSGDADAGDRILSLQTSFGGGKTHALVALWHLAKNTERIRRASGCAEVRRVLGDRLPSRVKGVAVFTNQTCDATQGRLTPEGVHTWTLWGELALQLGGVELYRKVEANDKARTVPQGLFTWILGEAAPCVILLDELADYCVGASAVVVGDATLADQTISFAQQLTQAVQQVPGVALVATLPASHLEVSSSEKGQEILNRLERRFGRMSADIRPVGDDEIYEVVRRRLFESLGDPAEHEAIADAYMRMYQQHHNEVLAEATRVTYKERLMASYPFHPSLIDGLYLRWGSHGDFQRTRGVLRLLASVVGDLWQRKHAETRSQPLIQPCHLRWTVDSLHAMLTRLWGGGYESVVAADVIGGKSNAHQLDETRGGEYATQRIAEGLAAAILLGSFGGQGERAGYSTKELKVAVSRPDLNWGYTDGALLGLEETSFYLHTAAAGSLGKRYWYGVKPTLIKLISQYRNQLTSSDFNAEIVETLQEQVRRLPAGGPGWSILVDPQEHLPERKSLTLLVLSPEHPHYENGDTSPAKQQVMALSQRCGSRGRLYRNTLLFLLPSSRGLGRLRRALRDVEALKLVQRDYGSRLDTEQQKELEERLATATKSVSEALGSAYAYISRVDGSEVVVAALSNDKPTFGEHLQGAWRQLVEDEEWVLRKVGMVTLQRAGLVPEEGGIQVRDAIEAFLRYTDKPMVTSRDAVLRGLEQACKERVIGIGQGLSPSNLQRRWCGEDVILDPEGEGFWIIPPFEEAEPEEAETAQTTTAATAVPGTSTTVEIPEVGAHAGRQVRRIAIKGTVPLDNWSEVFRCFVHPGTRMSLKQMRLGIDFTLEAREGQPLDENDPAVKAMVEAARQLGLDLTLE